MDTFGCRRGIGLATLIAGFLAAPALHAASCREMASLALPNTSITLAEEVPVGQLRLPAGVGGPAGVPAAALASLPAFCRVGGTIRPTPDSDIRFEVWMPISGWNGKFVGVGNGVWAGSISYQEMFAPLARGYATAATDDGHQGNPLDASFAVGHPEKLIDFGYRAPHEMTLAAKATIAAFYERKPERSLFVSCSTGGRQGLMQAHRYPEDYDGISSMAPANPMVPLMVASLWTGYVAMKDEASRIPPQKFGAIHAAAVQACDADDGLQDGLIGEPQRCRFDPAVMQCKGADAGNCLTAPQVAAVRAIYAGARNPRTGRQIYPGFPVGSEPMLPILTGGPEPFPVATTFLRGLVFEDQAWDFRTFDYDRDVERARKAASAVLDVPANGLGRFLAQRRKLLLTHGWSDGLIPAGSTIEFHDALRKSAGARRMAASVRLFMAPGVGHCAGGEGPSVIDHIGVLDAWVASGTAPERIVASNAPGQPARTRPLCAWPQVARYSGAGSTDEEKSFRCERPAK